MTIATIPIDSAYWRAVDFGKCPFGFVIGSFSAGGCHRNEMSV